MPTALSSPQTWAATLADGSHTVAYKLEQLIRLYFLGNGDSFSLRSLGLVPNVGDLAGSGTDTVQSRYLAGLDWAMEWDTGLGETDPLTGKSWSVDSSQISLGRWGLRLQQTAMREILQADGVDLARRALSIVRSYDATWMSALCAAAAGATGSAAGDPTRPLSPEDLMDVVDYYDTLETAEGMYAHVMLSPEAWRSVRAGLRSMPHLRNEFALEKYGFTFQPSGLVGGKGNVLFWKSSRVVESAGVDQSFAFVPGAFFETSANPERAAAAAQDKVVIQPAGTPILLTAHSGDDGALSSIVDGFALVGLGLGADEAERIVPIKSLAA